LTLVGRGTTTRRGAAARTEELKEIRG